MYTASMYIRFPFCGICPPLVLPLSFYVVVLVWSVSCAPLLGPAGVDVCRVLRTRVLRLSLMIQTVDLARPPLFAMVVGVSNEVRRRQTGRHRAELTKPDLYRGVSGLVQASHSGLSNNAAPV